MACGFRQRNDSTRGAVALMRSVTSSTLYSAMVRAAGSGFASRSQASASRARQEPHQTRMRWPV